jgi:CRP/FNR family transcriptional regulator, cyclic AMP receptor protein
MRIQASRELKPRDPCPLCGDETALAEREPHPQHVNCEIHGYLCERCGPVKSLVVLRTPRRQSKHSNGRRSGANGRATLPFNPQAFLSVAGAGKTISEYHMNEGVFSQGALADAIFFIEEGKVKVTVMSDHGKEAIVALLGPGDFLGEGCLAGQALRMAKASTMTPCTIMRLEKDEMIRVLHTELAFSEFFVAYLLARTIRVGEDLVDQMFNSSEKRLARALLLMANYGKEGKPDQVIAKVNHETLAEMIGTTRPRVNFFMNKFRQLGYIDYNGHLEIHSALLSVVLNEPSNAVKSSR